MKAKEKKQEKIEILFRSFWSGDVYDAFLERFSKKINRAKLSQIKKTIKEYTSSRQDRRDLFEDLKSKRKFFGAFLKTPSINKFMSFLNDIEFRVTDPGASSLEEVIREYERKNHVRIIFNPATQKWVCRK